MKDKYEKYFQENEGKNSKKEKIKVELLKLKYYLHILNKSGFKDFKIVVGMNINGIVQTLSMVSNYWQKWIKNNVINCIDHQSLMLTYISCLNFFLTKEEYKEVENVMNSFKKSEIIKDIKLNKNKKIFQLQTLDNQYIKFAPEFNNEKDVQTANQQCHAFTEAACIEYDNIYATTVIMKNYFEKSYYHSFIVKDGIVHDFAQNTVMSFENYKKLFGCKVIMSIEGKQLLRNIERLKERDIEYKKNEMLDVLKYAMHKQMKKGRI